MPPTDTTTRLSDRILEQLLVLRAADALSLVPLADGASRGEPAPEHVHRFTFRAAGWPVHVDLDDIVLEVRAHHGRESIAVGRVPERVMRVLLGKEPVPAGIADRADADDALAALRAIVADWRRRNARVFVSAPSVARHPDGWNNA